VQTISSFATLAVGYVICPLGAAIFGHFGDRVSRKRTLLITLTIMGIPTALIGVLPSSAQAGALAPILLIVLRLFQGFAVGGEWGGSVLMSVEHSRPEKRGLFGSATPLGLLICSARAYGMFVIVSSLPTEALLSGGWRIPFLVTVVLLPLACSSACR
jgi:MFS family permease